MGEVSEVEPSLDRDKRHIVWLDYDYPLNQDVVDDVSGLAATLGPESLLLVTVDADPRVELDDLPDDLLNNIRDHRRQTLQDAIGRYVDGGIRTKHVSKKELPTVYATVIQNRLRDELAVRSLEFFPIFNFAYADGRLMLSLGGMIGTKATAQKLKRTGVKRLPFVSDGPEPVVISVPPLTARERLWLDQNVGSPRASFEIQRDAVSHYRKYYRYYPSYFEALL
jgi:hypothetical protein